MQLFPQKTMMIEGRKVTIHNDCVFLNPDLIRKQKLTWLKVKLILSLHKEKFKILDMMQKSTNIKLIRRGAKAITYIEYDLQSAWGFKKDKKYHRFWEVPHCTCPKFDNEDVYPSNYYVINGSCLIHGTR